MDDGLIKVNKRRTMTGWPMLLGWLAMLIFAIHSSTHMVGAGDTWVAMACGRHFLNHGVDTVEPFSANSHKAGPTEEDIEKWPALARWIADKAGMDAVKYWHPTGWVNQNWLTHTIFYWLTHESPFADAENFSYNSLVYWKFAIYIITVICIYYTCRVLGVHPLLATIFSCFAMFVGRSFFDIRPAGFSNMLTAVFLLILALTTYRNALYIWLLVPLTVFWCNLHGGYIYVFIMLAAFVGLNFLTSISKKRFVSIGKKGIYHTIAAGFAAFLGTIIFNPFHLTNLTHTFVISFSKHAKMWRTVNEWHPAFEWKNPVGDEIPFLIMYIIAWLALVVWATVLTMVLRTAKAQSKKKLKNSDDYQLPKIDLALMAIAALSIYMAIRSRRFIPIAAIASCPVIAMFVEQMACSIVAVFNLYRHSRLQLNPMSKKLQSAFAITGAAAVLFFGIWWGLKYKKVYLGPWPTDTKLNSVFMRMTASDAKPFYAMQFIKDNKLKGKMFNYWTEGGFIAYGQQPDANTGFTPLQLFMDGRAQAAYEPKAYETWGAIMSGGPTVRGARIKKRKLTAKGYVKVNNWISEELRKRDVWLVMMPQGQFDSPFVKSFMYSTDWRVVFLNDRQKVMVDTKTPQGRKLFDGIFSGKTIYPDDFSKKLVKSHNIMLFGNKQAEKNMGLNWAIEAFKLKPSQVVVNKIIIASKSPELKPRVDEFCKNSFDDFEKNKNSYVNQDGYHNRIVVALLTGKYLYRNAMINKDKKLAKFYADKNKECQDERKALLATKRW